MKKIKCTAEPTPLCTKDGGRNRQAVGGRHFDRSKGREFPFTS